MGEMISIEDADFDMIKQKVVSLLNDISCRVPWSIFSKLLLDDAMIKARSFERLSRKLLDLNSSLVNRILLGRFLTLSSALVEHYLSGEKSLRLFKINDHLDALNFRNALDSIKPESKYRDILSINKEDFIASPTLVYKKVDGLGYYFGFASNRRVKLKQNIPSDALTEEYSRGVPYGSEMYIIKMENKFCFDVIFVPLEMDRIEFRIDTTEGLTPEYRSLAYSQLSSLFFAECRTHGCAINGTLLDFYPAIRKVLEIPVGDGRVVELKFTTDEGAMKHHKNRRGSKCILRDRYHLAGAEVIKDQFDPYYISRVWANPRTGAEPELVLPGSMRSNSSYGTTILDEAIITKTLNEDDYRFIVTKLLDIIINRRI
ncbi:hypothetical protein ACK3Z7_19045 [Aeromonas caviae]